MIEKDIFFIYHSGFENEGVYAKNLTEVCRRIFDLFGWWGKYSFINVYESIERRINDATTNDIILDRNLGLNLFIL